MAHNSPRRIWLVDESDWTSLANKIRLAFQVSESRTKGSCIGSPGSRFSSDFDRVKSNVSPRLSTYPREIFARTTPLWHTYNILMNISECRSDQVVTDCPCKLSCYHSNKTCEEDRACARGCECPHGLYDNGTKCVERNQCFCVTPDGTIRKVKYILDERLVYILVVLETWVPGVERGLLFFWQIYKCCLYSFHVGR